MDSIDSSAALSCQNNVIQATEEESFEPHPKGLGYCLFEGLKEHSGNVIQTNVDDGSNDTAKDLLQRSVRTAIEMKKLGIKPGDVISVYSHSQMNSASAFAAATFVGAINASLDPFLSEADVQRLLAQVSPKMVFVSTECEEIIERVLKELKVDAKIVVFGESKRNYEYATFIAPKEGEDEFTPWVAEDLNATIIVLFSSGTTGLAKGICWSHSFALYMSRLRYADKILSSNSLFWIIPTTLIMICMRFGTTKLFAKIPDTKLLWNQIETYHLDMLILSPYLAMQFIDNHPIDFASSLKVIMLAGGGTSIENIKKIEATLPNAKIFIPYGQTEAGNLFESTNTVAQRKGDCLSLGTPFPYVSYKVVDAVTGKALGPNQRGELLVKSNFRSSGYYNRDSSEMWDEEGYLKTGDIFYYDEDKNFFIVDRVKEMFKFRGYHITPTKYEQILQGHPEIDMAAVIGVPHPEEEHHICGVVKLVSGSKLTPEEIEAFYNGCVSDIYKIRAGVVIVDSLPLTPSGKLKRPMIKEMVLKKLGKA